MNLSLAIVLMSGLVLGSVHFLLIQHYISSEETERLKNEVSKIKHLTELLLENYSTVGHKFYQLSIDDVSTDNNCYVIVADKEGNIIAGSSNYGEIIPEGKVDPGVYSDILDGTRDTSSSIVVEPSGVRLLAVSSAVKMSGQRGVVSPSCKHAPYKRADIFHDVPAFGFGWAFHAAFNDFVVFPFHEYVKTHKAPKRIRKGNRKRRFQ